MGAFDFCTPTNTTDGSLYDKMCHAMPSKVHMFIVVEELGKDGMLVRKIYASPTDPFLIAKNLPEIRIKNEVFPEMFGMKPVKPDSSATVAEHVYSSKQHPSKYISTSSEFPGGSPRFEGKTVFIDIAKAKAAGAELVTTEEIVIALEEYKKIAPKRAPKINDLIVAVKNIDKEVLVDSPHVPARAIFTPGSFRATSVLVKSARVVGVFAIVFTAYDLEQAAESSIKQKSIKPISHEVIKQAGGWGGAMAGARIGVAFGAAVGIETGPGAIVTGLIGGIIFGTAGYFSASWIAEHAN
ncbi:MAG: glycine zipper family protein [Burkholderiaceae bacterium]